MTRPLSTLGAPAESSSAPEIPITIREVSVEDAETFWTDGTDARSAEPPVESTAQIRMPQRFPVASSREETFGSRNWTEGADARIPAASAHSDLLDALTCRLIFAARKLAMSAILHSDFLSISEGLVPSGNQVCTGCAMHSQRRKLTHTPSCPVGEVLSILDRMQDAVPARRQEAELLEQPSVAEAGTPSRVDANNPGDYGKPWQYKEMVAGGTHVVSSEGCFIASLHGSAQEQLDYAERIVACVNFCAGIPTEMLLDEKPLASMTRDIHQVIAAGRLLPGLDRLRTSQGMAR